MGSLDGRVAIITGAGRGIGREHALLFASEGAKVVVNDLGGAMDGSGDDRTAAEQVADEIKGLGGEAVANADNVADWEGAQRLINTAVEAFGDLHVLVNNAGILRDRVIINMTEDEWDAVVAVHLKGHFCPTRHAAVYWREQTKAGKTVNAWAWEGDADPRTITSNTTKTEWPRGSGEWVTYPEIDRCAWFDAATAKQKTNSAQAELIDRLEAELGKD